jgi:hypothetical protein
MSKTAIISIEQGLVTLIMQGVRASKSLLILFDVMFSVKNLVPRLSLPSELVVPAVAWE